MIPTSMLLLSICMGFDSPPGLPPGSFARLGSQKLCHGDSPYRIAISPNGTRIASGGTDGAIRLWNAQTGACLGTFFVKDQIISTLGFTTDGQFLLAHSSDHNVRFFKTDTFVHSHTQQVSEMLNPALSADGASIGGLSQTRRLRIRDCRTGKEIWNPTADGIVAFDIHPEGFVLSDGTNTWHWAFMGDGNTRQAALKSEWKSNDTDGVAFVVMAASGDMVATAGAGPGSRVRLYIVGKEQAVADWAGEGPVAFAKGKVIVGRKNGKATVWKVGEAEPIRVFETPAVTMAVSADGSTLATAGERARIRVWSLATGNEQIVDQDQLGSVSGVYPTTNGLRVVAGRTVYHWPVGAGPAEIRYQSTNPILASAATANAMYLSTAQSTTDLTGTLLPFAKIPQHLAAAPDGSAVVGAWGDQVARYMTATGTMSAPWDVLGAVLAVAVAPGGTKIATVSVGGFLRMYEIGTPPRELWYQRVPRSQQTAVAISPDGTQVAVASILRVEIFDTKTGTKLWYIERSHEDGPFLSVAFSADGRFVAAGCQGHDGGIVVYERATRTLACRFTSQAGSVRHLAFISASTLVSVTADDCILAWDVSTRRGMSPPTQKEMQQAWVALARTSAAIGNPAMETLLASPKECVKLIAEGVRNAGNELKQIESLVEALDAPLFLDREIAQKALADFGMRAVPLLIPAAKAHDSPEVRKRAKMVINSLEADGEGISPSGLFGHPLRLVRAVNVLETIGGIDAKKVLQDIAAIPGPGATAAVEAIKRMK